ncbi:1681_t:CDS:1, partial [Acaulospora colombiana]
MERNALQAERLNILTKIKNFERRPLLDEKHEMLQKLERQYNNLMENLWQLEPNPRFDPICKLPSELCRAIIYEV